MPGKSSARPNVISTRVTHSGYAAIEKYVVEFGVPQAEVVRVLFQVALTHDREIRTVLNARKVM